MHYFSLYFLQAWLPRRYTPLTEKVNPHMLDFFIILPYTENL